MLAVAWAKGWENWIFQAWGAVLAWMLCRWQWLAQTRRKRGWRGMRFAVCRLE